MAAGMMNNVFRALRITVPIMLLGFQMGAIVHARSVTSRYFCWAPFDTQTAYTAHAVVNGHELTPKEFLLRYRRPERGFNNRSPGNAFDMFEEREEKAEKLGDHTTIDVTYTVDGKGPYEWHWPPNATISSAPSIFIK